MAAAGGRRSALARLAPLAVFAAALALHALLVSPDPSLERPNEGLGWLVGITGSARTSLVDRANGSCTTVPFARITDAFPHASMERPGVPVLSTPLYLFFGIFGLRLVHGLMTATACLLVFCTARRVSGRPDVALACMVLLALHPASLFWDPLGDASSRDIVPRPFQSNRPIILLASALLAELVLRGPPSPRRALAAGLGWGAACGVLHELVVLALPLAWWLRRHRSGGRTVAAFAAGTLAAVAPWMVWYQDLCGSVFVHPTQGCLLLCDPSRFRDPIYCDRSLKPVAEAIEYVHVYRVGGLELPFLGRLNFVGGTTLRTPGYPFPVFALIPLRILAWLGLPLAAAALLGPWSLGPGRRSFLGISVLWSLAWLALLAPQESWDWDKERLFLPFVPPVTVFLAAGLARLARPGGTRALAAALATVIAALALLSLAKFPPDLSWYVLFPEPHLAPALYARESRIDEVRSDEVRPRLLPIAAHASRLSLALPGPRELSPRGALDAPRAGPVLERISHLPEGAAVLSSGDVGLIQAVSHRCAFPLLSLPSPASAERELDRASVTTTLCDVGEVWVHAPGDAGLIGGLSTLGDVGDGLLRASLTPEARRRYCEAAEPLDSGTT